MRIGAIVNPRAGSWARLHDPAARREPLEAVRRWLSPQEPERLWAQAMCRAEDGARLAREAIAEGCDTLVAVGGDGTLNDVIQGIRSVAGESQPRLGILPMGTANVLARALGLPLHAPQQAAQIVLAGQERTIDLGRVGERCFALVAGIGFDGAVTRAVNFRLKRRVGEWAYLLAAARLALSFPRAQVMLTLDGGAAQTFDAYLILIANAGRYAGRFRLGAEVRLDDGLLDVFVCLRRRPLAAGIASDALALARNRFDRAPGVRHFQAQHIVVDADSPLPIQLDGDTAGQTPATFEVLPGALRVLAPPR